MASSFLLHSDLQELLNQYASVRDRLSALRVLNEKQQQFLKEEREKSAIMKDKMKNMVRWLIKREKQHKSSLDHLETENRKLQCTLDEKKREYEQAELLNKDKNIGNQNEIRAVSKLQKEVDLLRIQVTQLEEKRTQKSILRNERKDENFNEDCLEEANMTKLLLEAENNITRKGILKDIDKHPAFIMEEENKIKKLPGVQIVKVARKRRKLFQEDKEVAIDIT